MLFHTVSHAPRYSSTRRKIRSHNALALIRVNQKAAEISFNVHDPNTALVPNEDNSTTKHLTTTWGTEMRGSSDLIYSQVLDKLGQADSEWLRSIVNAVLLSIDNSVTRATFDTNMRVRETSKQVNGLHALVRENLDLKNQLKSYDQKLEELLERVRKQEALDKEKAERRRLRRERVRQAQRAAIENTRQYHMIIDWITIHSRRNRGGKSGFTRLTLARYRLLACFLYLTGCRFGGNPH